MGDLAAVPATFSGRSPAVPAAGLCMLPLCSWAVSGTIACNRVHVVYGTHLAKCRQPTPISHTRITPSSTLCWSTAPRQLAPVLSWGTGYRYDSRSQWCISTFQSPQSCKASSTCDSSPFVVPSRHALRRALRCSWPACTYSWTCGMRQALKLKPPVTDVLNAALVWHLRDHRNSP